METENKIWIYINKHYTEEEEVTGSLLEFIINDIRWELNYRGDAPLLIYRSNDGKQILQIDGDLFFPDAVDLALKMLNMLLYADLELELNPDEYDESDSKVYELYYDGEQHDVFNHFLQKVKEEKEITKEDIITLK